MNDADRQWLRDALEKVLSGEDPKKAFGLSGRQHQGRRGISLAEESFSLQVAIEVEKLRAQGMGRDDAHSNVAEMSPALFGRKLEMRTVKKHHKRFWAYAAWHVESKRLGGYPRRASPLA